MRSPLVSVVVLSYSWTQHLQRALQSVAGQSYSNLEILLVNNKGPATDEIVRIGAEFSQVRLIRNAANLGFTGGMNVGIAEATGEYVHLTEDDVVLHPGCIAELVAFMEHHPEAGLAAPVMYNVSPRTIRSAGGRFTLGSIYRMTILGQDQTDTGQFPEPFDVMYIPGASIFARTSLLRDMKGFREDYFMYWEDLELCIRILKSGRRIVTVPSAGVDHFEPPPGPSSDLIDFLRVRNFFVTYLLHAPAAALPSFFVRYALMDVLRSMTHDTRRAKLVTKAWMSFLARVPRLLSERDSRHFP